MTQHFVQTLYKLETNLVDFFLPEKPALVQHAQGKAVSTISFNTRKTFFKSSESLEKGL